LWLNDDDLAILLVLSSTFNCKPSKPVQILISPSKYPRTICRSVCQISSSSSVYATLSRLSRVLLFPMFEMPGMVDYTPSFLLDLQRKLAKMLRQMVHVRLTASGDDGHTANLHDCPIVSILTQHKFASNTYTSSWQPRMWVIVVDSVS